MAIESIIFLIFYRRTVSLVKTCWYRRSVVNPSESSSTAKHVRTVTGIYSEGGEHSPPPEVYMYIDYENGTKVLEHA